MTRLALHVLGPPRIERDGVTVQIRRRNVIALLVYLAVTGRSHSRDTLATLFWPEHDQSGARAGLRRTLASLKKALSGEYLEVSRESVGLCPGADVWLDMVRFQKHLAECQTHEHGSEQICPACISSLENAVTLYQDDFLSGFTLRGSPGFDEWQFFQTESLRRELASALERLARGYSAQGAHELAIPCARRWLALDPLHEPAHRRLMWLYAVSGQRAAALRQHGECERVLLEELGVPPEEETAQLYEAIKEKRDLPQPGGHTVAPSSSDILNGRYRLGSEIGRGGTGIVYRAHDSLLERDVAVKILSDATLGTEGRTRLLDEAQITAKLNHPNIVSVYDAGQAGKTSFIVTELVEGESLQELNTAGNRRAETLDEILAIVRQVCAALDHAHRNGIIHRDLKPENIILTADGTAKLTDFGLARPVASRITSEGAITGTVFYLAPELALGQVYDGRADLYALGIVLYELTTGSLPFTADNPMAVISQHVHAPVVPPRARNAQVPPALDHLIVHLLSKDPKDRPASAAQVLRTLDQPGIVNTGATPAEEVSVLTRFGRGRLVGREGELGEASSLWSRTLVGEGQTLLVGGEAGIGKTRLVRELATQVQVSGGRVLEGACYAEGGVPYAPFSQILRRALEGDPQARQRLPEFVLADLLALAPALRLNLRQIQPAPALDDPSAEQHRLFENLAVCFTALSESAPLLLVLEDIHWADSGTLFLARHLARHTREQRIMIVATHREVRPEEARTLYEVILDLERERRATRLRLPRLDRDQTLDMLAGLFSQEIPPDFLAGIYRETEGNPFFIEEVCKALVDSGKVYFSDGRWHGPRVEELGIPRTVRVAIQSRIRVLPTEAQETLRLAAVLGRQFNFNTLAEASTLADAGGQDDETLIEALESAERAQLIEEVSEEGGGTFSFVNALIPATLVESLRTLERRRLHRRAATAIQSRHPDDFEALAHHYRQAGNEKEAATYLLQAGDRARRLYVHQEAVDNYQQALEILKTTGEVEQVARTLMKLGLTYHNAFDFRAAREAYQEGFVFWQRIGEAQHRTADRPAPAPHALRVAAIEPATLGLGLSMDFPSHVMLDQLFSGLLETSPEMGLVPDVARSWEVLEGGRKYIFHLRDDVLWSDGVPVTAEDFAYTWRRVLSPTGGWRWHQYLFDIKGAMAFYQGEITDPDQVGVRALDDLTLAMELEGPTSYFPNLMAFVTGFPMPRHAVEVHGAAWAEWDKVVTNGPFRLAEWQRGESLVLERNPTYHGRFSGNLERVECSFLSGRPERSLRMYEEGHLDICGDLPLGVLARARQRHAGEYVSGPWLSTGFIGFDVSRPPFDDRRVRLALVLATDRERLANVTLRGYAFPAVGGLIPPGMPGHSPGIGLPYDPESARDLLAQAGYPGGRGFPALECVARDDPGFDLLCEHLRTQWLENLGVEIVWKQIEWGWFYDRKPEETPRMWMVGWYADYPDPDDFLRIQWWLDPAWENQEYQRLVEGARRVMDQPRRMRMYQQADGILVEEAPVIPLAYGRFHMLVKPWVKQLFTSPLKWWSWKDILLEPH